MYVTNGTVSVSDVTKKAREWMLQSGMVCRPHSTIEQEGGTPALEWFNTRATLFKIFLKN